MLLRLLDVVVQLPNVSVIGDGGEISVARSGG